MVYCNNEIVAIDFNVFNSASYPFFIEDDLCEIRIKREGHTFHYSLESNQEVDTPFNRMRKKLKKKYRFQLIVFVAGVLVCSAVFSFFALRGEKRSKQKAQLELLDDNGIETIGKVFSLSSARGKPGAFFSYVGGGQIQETPFDLPEGGILPNGMPMEDGDEFVVRYHPVFPQVSIIDFGKPTGEQMERYRLRSLEHHLRLHPDVSAARAACLLEIAFEIKQLEGYADFFWQNAEPGQNSNHNRNSYLRLVRDVPFAREVKERCY